MATEKLQGSSRPSEKLLLRISKDIDPRHLSSVAIDVDVGDVQLSRIQADLPGSTLQQAFKVLKAWDESSSGPNTQQLIDQVWEWKRKGYVDVDVMENIQQLVDIDLKTTQSNKILKDGHLHRIAETVTMNSELSELAVKVLYVRDLIAEQALHDHPRDILKATLVVLRHWLRQQTNREEAYTIMYASLRNAQWNQIAAKLKNWVEG